MISRTSERLEASSDRSFAIADRSASRADDGSRLNFTTKKPQPADPARDAVRREIFSLEVSRHRIADEIARLRRLQVKSVS